MPGSTSSPSKWSSVNALICSSKSSTAELEAAALEVDAATLVLRDLGWVGVFSTGLKCTERLVIYLKEKNVASESQRASHAPAYRYLLAWVWHYQEVSVHYIQGKGIKIYLWGTVQASLMAGLVSWFRPCLKTGTVWSSSLSGLELEPESNKVLGLQGTAELSWASALEDGNPWQ